MIIFSYIVAGIAAVMLFAVVKSFFKMVKCRRLIAKLPEKVAVRTGIAHRLKPVLFEGVVLAAHVGKLSQAYRRLSGKTLNISFPDYFTEEMKAQKLAESQAALDREILIGKIAVIFFISVLVMQILLIFADRFYYLSSVGLIFGDRFIKPEHIRYELSGGHTARIRITGCDKPVPLMTSDEGECDRILMTYYEPYTAETE